MTLNVHFFIHYLLSFWGNKKATSDLYKFKNTDFLFNFFKVCPALFSFLSEQKLPAEQKEATASFSKFQNAALFFHTHTHLRVKAACSSSWRSGNDIDHIHYMLGRGDCKILLLDFLHWIPIILSQWVSE